MSGRSIVMLLVVQLFVMPCFLPAQASNDGGMALQNATKAVIPSAPMLTNRWIDMSRDPTSRDQNSLVYDSRHDRILLFGGKSWNETWAYDLENNTWMNLNPSTNPMARDGFSLAYDSKSDRVILFGGWFHGTLNDTWAYDYDLNTWTNMNPLTEPRARWGSALAYDSKSDRVILFGGLDYNTHDMNETWAYDYDNNTWTNITTSVGPPVRVDHPLVYDSKSDRIILFGGHYSPDTINRFYRDDTWTYDYNNNTWANMTTSIKPPARAGHALAHDEKDDRIILFGGIGWNYRSYNDTWAYDYNNNAWINMNPPTNPPARYGHAVAYESKSDRIVLLGDDTWAYNYKANKWMDMTSSKKPPARSAHALSYDSKYDRTILFGGETYTKFSDYKDFNDTWTYDFRNNTWMNMTSTARPSARYGHALAYDSKSDRVILFGGCTQIPGYYIYHDDTWAYDLNNNTWINMTTSIKPPSRYGHTLAYDSKRDRTILYGGNHGSYFNDTWAYDYHNNSWMNITASTGPLFRTEHGFSYDSRSNRFILFGGEPSIHGNNDTWAFDYDNNTWTDMKPSTAPESRYGLTFSYDSENDRVILFGGQAYAGLGQWITFGDTWIFDYNTNIWTNMTTGNGPLARIGHAMVYDSQNSRVILFGGDSDLGEFDDTWVYELDLEIVPHVESTLPTNSATNVSIKTDITIRFNMPMNKTATESSISSTPTITGTFSWDPASMNVTWNPSSDLQFDTKYTITISAAAKSETGVNMRSPYTFSFTTITPPDSYPPYIVSTYPTGGMVNVPINTAIIIEWNESMNQSSVMNAFSSKPSISCTWIWIGATYTCKPDTWLQSKTNYTITIAGTAKDLAGNEMKVTFIFSFTTSAVQDLSPPYVVSTMPSRNAKDIAVNASIVIEWNETMDRASAEDAFSSTPGISCAWSWDGVRQTCTPRSPLEPGTKYTISIAATVLDVAGNHLLIPYTFSFTTKGTPANGEGVPMMLYAMAMLVLIVALLTVLMLLLKQKRRRSGETKAKIADIKKKETAEEKEGSARTEKRLVKSKKKAIENIRRRRERAKR